MSYYINFDNLLYPPFLIINSLESDKMATGKEPPQQVEMTSPLDIEATATHESEIHHLNEKVFDGDEALKVLHTHYEPYSPEEEKSLLRKIDYRMCTLMLIISKKFLLYLRFFS